jgi:hypothetical protein
MFVHLHFIIPATHQSMAEGKHQYPYLMSSNQG